MKQPLLERNCGRFIDHSQRASLIYFVMQQNQFSVEGYEVILGILVQEGYIGVGTVNKLLCSPIFGYISSSFDQKCGINPL